MSKNTVLLLLAAGAAYLYYKSPISWEPSFMVCKYPDGTLIQIPQGNACPYDMTHGGQSQKIG